MSARRLTAVGVDANACGVAPPLGGINAAVAYRDALKAVPIDSPDFAGLATADPSPEPMLRLVARGCGALDLLRRGRLLAECDWQIDPYLPAGQSLEFLTPLERLSVLALLQADLDALDGKPAEAAARLCDLLVLARRIQGVPLLGARLVGANAESNALGGLAHHLPAFDAAAASVVTETIRTAPPVASLDDVVAAQERTGESLTPSKLRMARQTDQWIAVRRALLLAAIGAPRGNAASFASAADPVTGNPIQFRALPRGYELTSDCQLRGKPVKLVVGEGE